MLAEHNEKIAPSEPRRKFRIGIVFGNIWGTGGGLHRALSTIVNLLTERGFDVEIVTFTTPDFQALERLHGLRLRPSKVYSTKYYQYLPSLLRQPLITAWAILNTVSMAKDVDFVILLGLEFLPARFVPYSRNKVLVYQIGPKWNSTAEIMGSEDSIARKVTRLAYGLLWPSILGPSNKDFYMIHNSWAKKLVERDFGLEPNKVLSLPIPSVQLGDESRRQNRVVSFGRFHPEKRHEVAIEAIERVVRRQPDVELYIMGMTNLPMYADPVLTQLAEMVKEKSLENNVKILKNLSYEQVMNMMKTCKVIMSNELEPEAYVLALLEGMACGCVPVIPAVDRGAWDDILEHGKYGFGFDNVDEAAEEIMRVISLPEKEYRILSEAAIARSRSFGEESFASALDSVMREILAR